MLTAQSLAFREGCMSSSCLTTTLPVASPCCGRLSGSVWLLRGSMVRQEKKQITTHPIQTSPFKAFSQHPSVTSVRRRPFHGRRGSNDRISAVTLHEVVLVLRHTFCLCGGCCSVCFSLTFTHHLCNADFFLAHRQCSCSMWWTISPLPTTQCTLIPCGVKHLAGRWLFLQCSVSLLPFCTNFCAAKDLCGRSVCLDAGAGMHGHHSLLCACVCDESLEMCLLGNCPPLPACYLFCEFLRYLLKRAGWSMSPIESSHYLCPCLSPHSGGSTLPPQFGVDIT